VEDSAAASVFEPDLGVSDNSCALPVDMSSSVVPARNGAHRPLRPNEGLLGATRLERTLKRAVDVVLGLGAIAILAPLLLTTATLIKLTSRGPVLHVQERVGEQGRRIRFVKFRTMRLGAHHEKDELLGDNECDGPIFKMREDPRVTWIGRLLRRFSIDELPQLFLVIKGDLSLVGPRPPLPEEVLHYGDWEHQRLLVKPGITCVWQVSGRSDLDFDTWVAMDIEYIRRWSPLLDVAILAKTIPAVLSTRGAY